MSSHCQIVIPARLASTRLSEKLLRRAGGKSVLQHTYESALRSTIVDDVIVAVDDQRLADEVDRFGGRWIMTDPNCASGTDRIAEVAASIPAADVFVNVQGDEPEIDPAAIDLVAKQLIDDPLADMATIGTAIRELTQLNNPACVKIVMALDPSDPTRGRAVYFSRSAVPYARDGVEQTLQVDPPLFWHHIGLYAYRRDFLLWFADQPPSRLENTERLEQLRAIEAGKKIVVAAVDQAARGIDTIEDLDAFIQRLQ